MQKVSNFRYFFSLCYAAIGGISFLTEEYFLLAQLLVLIALFQVIDKLSKGVVIRETMAFLYCFTCVYMPMFGYTRFNRYNPLALVWVRYMMVAPEVYYKYAIPAISFFCLAATLPTKRDVGEGVKGIIEKLKLSLSKTPKAGLYIVGVGLASLVMMDFVPSSLQYFFSLFFSASFAGVLYIYFAPNFRFKKLILIGFVVFIVISALRSGMFTLIAYMGATIFSFFFLKKRISLVKKTMVIGLAAFLLIMIQSVKQSYRVILWSGNIEGNEASVYGKLFMEKLRDLDKVLADEMFFPIYYRTNQGFNIGLVMLKFPEKMPYDQGKKLAVDAMASVVPRFLWPDKPMAGGRENMMYYANYRLVGYSTNVGPLGESFGSFGPYWGIFFMFCLGLLIRWAYIKVFKIASRLPAFICWLPVLFYQVEYSAETDTLQIFNSLIKTGAFIAIIYIAIPGAFFAKSIFATKRKLVRKPQISI